MCVFRTRTADVGVEVLLVPFHQCDGPENNGVLTIEKNIMKKRRSSNRNYNVLSRFLYFPSWRSFELISGNTENFI